MTKVKNTQKTEIQQHDVFTLAKKDDKIIIVLGNAIISEKQFTTFKEAKSYIDSKPYELIINSTCYAVENFKNPSKNETK